MIIMSPQKTGERIAWYRRSEGLSQRGLAAKAGIHPQTLGNIERGRTEIAVSTLQSLAKALGVTCAHLLGEVDLLDGFIETTVRA